MTTVTLPCMGLPVTDSIICKNHRDLEMSIEGIFITCPKLDIRVNSESVTGRMGPFVLATPLDYT